MHELKRNQTILVFFFGHPSSKLHNCFSQITPLRTLLSKCRILKHDVATYPDISSRTVFMKKIKRLKLKVCTFIYLPQKANSSHLYLFNHSDWHCICCFHISNYKATLSCAHTCLQEHYNTRGGFVDV